MIAHADPGPSPASPLAGGARLLIIEDDLTVSFLLEESLTLDGFEVRVAEDPASGLRMHQARPADLIILDRTFPEGDGLALLRRLRSSGQDVPVLILSALGSVPERVEGLAEGADDYLPKPFSFLELQARIQALLRRTGRGPAPVRAPAREASGPGLVLDRTLMRAYRDGRDLETTPQEYRLLSLLVAHAGQALSRSELLNLGWPASSRPANVRTVDVYMARLRTKLGTWDGQPLIVTVGGAGYLCRAQGTAP